MHELSDEVTTLGIQRFQLRMETELEFCRSLYRNATVRLLCHKYAYYVLSEQTVKDVTYDLEERHWFQMGRALGVLREDETSPCVDFDPAHPLASEGISLAKKLLRIK